MPFLITPGKQSSNSPVLISLLVSGIVLAFISIVILGSMITKVRNEASHMAPPAYPTGPYIPKLCTSRDCLWEASTMTENMNFSTDPCDDFYHFACGNYLTVHPPPNWYTPQDILSILSDENDEKLKDSLESPVKDTSVTSAESKGKVYFGSCIDDYFKTKTGGKPLAQDIVNIGGWYPLYNTFHANTWDNDVINSVLQHAHTTYYTNPFFTINVNEDWDSSDPNKPAEKYMLQFSITSLGMGSRSYYLQNDSHTQVHVAGYKAFIQGYIKLLIKDWGTKTPNLQEVLDTAFNDILYVETQIANITDNTSPGYGDVHKPVQYIIDNFKGNVSWLNLLINYYPQAGITSQTMVHLHEEDYLQQINTLITTLTPRQLNNYIMWKIAYNYVSDLGWEYVHLNRVWAMVKYDGWVYFTGQYNWCIIQMKNYLSYLLSAFFVQDHFVDVSPQQVQGIFDASKAVLRARIDTYSWLDEAAKKTAKQKLDTIKDKIGHPAWLADPNQLNAYYSSLTIAKDLHFKNIMSIYNFDRTQEALLLQKGTVDQTKWPEGIYQTNMWYTYDWNEMFIPAGFLQHPIFDYRVPQYVNFASMGRWVGRFLGYVIGPYGYYYDANGYYVDKTWWSQDSLNAWNHDIMNCHTNRFVNETFCNPYIGCRQLTYPSNYASRDYQYGLALNVSYTAYHNYIQQNGNEMAMPGFFGNSTEQLFFLAFAQSFCVSEDPFYSYYFWQWTSRPEIAVNVLMREFPNFSKAFNCPATSRMGMPKQQCGNL